MISEINATSLLEDLKSIHNNQKISAIKNFYTIILCLGVKRTLIEFIPFIMELVDEEDDIILIEINNQLKVILDFVGETNFEIVYNLYEKISFTEEEEVKKSSLESFSLLISCIKIENFINFLIERINNYINSNEEVIAIGLILRILKCINSRNDKLIE